MAKTCKHLNCINPIFSNGYCQSHQRDRTDDRYIRKYRANKGIPKYTKRERIREFNFGFDNQIDLFSWCWDDAQNEKGEVFCKFTGEKLNKFHDSLLFLNIFAHILNKKNYPWFKYNPENVCPVFPEFHRIVDAGSSKDRAEHPTWRFDLWDARVIAMKQQYIEFKRKNLLA